MKQALGIFVFTLAITLFYNYVGQLVPQKEVYPPKTAEIRADMSNAEMVEAGKILVEGKGTCLNCHNGSQRFPDFNLPTPIGARAKDRRAGYSDVDYLAEALCDPNSFIVEPFAPGMPPVNKPPIGLSAEEILAVIAYMQSMGGNPTVTMQTKLKHCQDSAPSAAAPAAGNASPAGAAKPSTGQDLVAQHGCMGCHSFTSPDRMVGPSLYDVGAKLNKTQLYESLLDPDVTVSAGFPPGLMSATLKGGGFYEKTTSRDLQVMVEYLSSLKGAQ